MSNGVLIQAQMLIDEEQYDRAYEMLEKAYEKLKDDAEYLEKIALLAKTMEKTEDAAKYWEELVVVNPNALVGYAELLDVYENTNKYKYYITRAKYKILNEKVTQSIDDYKKAINNTQDEVEIVNARFLLAKAYEHVGKTQNAIDEYYAILEQKSDMAIYYKLADMYAEMGDRFSAINVLEKGVKAFPQVNELAEYLSALYLKEEQPEKALEYSRNSFSKAKALLVKGDNEEALKVLNSIEDKQNANLPALYAEYYFNKKDWEKCTEYIEQFKTIAPQNPLVYQMKALVCDANNDLYGYHFNMGKCYSYKQDYDLALAEYLNAHRHDAKQSGAVKEIIKINEASGDKTSSMEFYEKLVRQEPDNPIALKGLGDVYADMYEFRNALEYYEKLVKVDSNNYEAYSKLGLCYEKLKNTQKAKECYEICISKAPLSPDIEKLKEKVSKMVVSDGPLEGESDGLIDKIMKLFKK
ncbi:MAG: tetratricopeptide repeat protein [Candidatus Gastranaerophilales bacterium]|nr:tetratricopeptide repeat protein [Candidatus Gastranaerophilales bacterium]